MLKDLLETRELLLRRHTKHIKHTFGTQHGEQDIGFRAASRRTIDESGKQTIGAIEAHTALGGGT